MREKLVLLNHHSNTCLLVVILRKIVKAEKKLIYVLKVYSVFVKKNNKNLDFELQLKTPNEKQKIVCTTPGVKDVDVTINSFYLYLRSTVPSLQQEKLIESNK